MMISNSTLHRSLRPLIRNLGAFRSMNVLSKESGEEFKKENFSVRMKKTGRPVSPHVTIYAFPITALSSIANRATGIALSFGCLGLGAIEIAGGNGAALHVMESIAASSFLLAGPAKFAVSFPLIYHYLGGVRHLMWDYNPDLLTTKQTEQTSYALLGTSLAASGILMFV